jgi:hypothetical protein
MRITLDIDFILESNKHKLIGSRKFSTLSRTLKKIMFEFGVERVTVIDVFESNMFSFGGEYDQQEDVINIEFIVPKDRNDNFNLNEKQWSEFKFQCNQNLQHEMIHRIQTLTRNDSHWCKFYKIEPKGPIHKLEERVYLSDIDEVEAFAHDLAMEIEFYYPKTKMDEILRNPSRFRKLPTYKVYKNAFRNTDWSIVRKMLLKKTYKNLKS